MTLAMSRRARARINSATEGLPVRVGGSGDIESGGQIRTLDPSGGSHLTMSVEGFVYQRILDGLDETTRIVIDLHWNEYSVGEIARALALDEEHIDHIIRSVDAELLAGSEIAGVLLSHIGAQGLLTSPIDKGASGRHVDTGHGGFSDDKKARARLRDFRREWSRDGTCTAPADRPRAEGAIVRLYAALGVPPPRFIWCDSPMAAQRVLRVLARRQRSRRTAAWLSLPPALREALGYTLPASRPGAWLGDALRGSRSWLQAALRTARKDWLEGALKGALPTYEERALLAVALEDPLWDSGSSRGLLEPAVRHALLGSLRASRISYRATPLRGQTEADWIERLLFFRDVVGIPCARPLSDHLDRWADLARSCLWWWPYREVCVVCERPAEIHSPDGRRLHHDTGPAVRFRDGWSIWAIDGVLVDEQIFLRPETQSLRQIRRERNVEVRRIRIERYGWDRYLARVGAVVVDRRRNDVEATQETLLRAPDGETVLVCACPSTARVYVLAVPPDIPTCERAQEWVSGGLAGRIINGA
jgi:hypothetical protein